MHLVLAFLLLELKDCTDPTPYIMHNALFEYKKRYYVSPGNRFNHDFGYVDGTLAVLAVPG